MSEPEEPEDEVMEESLFMGQDEKELSKSPSKEPSPESKPSPTNENTPSESEPKPRRRKQKKVLKKITKVDQLGYLSKSYSRYLIFTNNLVTRTEEVFESCSESEDDSKPTSLIPSTLPSVPVKPAKKSTAKSKQASLKSFFKPR